MGHLNSGSEGRFDVPKGEKDGRQVAACLMRMALALLDEVGEADASVHLQLAIDRLVPDRGQVSQEERLALLRAILDSTYEGREIEAP